MDFSTVCEEVDVEFAESIFCTNVMLIGFSVCGGGILILFCFKLDGFNSDSWFMPAAKLQPRKLPGIRRCDARCESKA